MDTYDGEEYLFNVYTTYSVVLNKFNLKLCCPNAASIKLTTFLIFGNTTHRVANASIAKMLFYSISNAESKPSASIRISFNFGGIASLIIWTTVYVTPVTALSP